ncbi:MAG: DUF1353 domain-containing protein [Hyphomicrobiaceae bacterium]|nr:DUF1353 domain-containing protein [Hyphomicrobiaceae bacterium]
MARWWKMLVVATATLGLTGCLDQLFGWQYDQTKTGELKGTLQIRWLSQDKFLFVPDAADPLVFKRADGTVIQPQSMYTDGGTIPSALRAIKAYSPWGYAPAFIIHDWLFVMKQCKLQGHEAYDLDTAAMIMAEAMKTLMEKPDFGGPNKLVHYSMYEAVRTSTARDYWENGVCNPAGAAMSRVPEKSATRSLEAAPSSTPAASPMPTITIKIR